MTTRYFFDVTDGGALYADATGTDLSTLHAARHEAMGILQDLVRDEISDGESRSFVTTARNARGFEFFRATLTIDSDGGRPAARD